MECTFVRWFCQEWRSTQMMSCDYRCTDDDFDRSRMNVNNQNYSSDCIAKIRKSTIQMHVEYQWRLFRLNERYFLECRCQRWETRWRDVDLRKHMKRETREDNRMYKYLSEIMFRWMLEQRKCSWCSSHRFYRWNIRKMFGWAVVVNRK